MKLYFKLAAFGVTTLAWWGLLIPFLVSANDDILAIAGLMAIITYPVIPYVLFRTNIKNVKSKMENL